MRVLFNFETGTIVSDSFLGFIAAHHIASGIRELTSAIVQVQVANKMGKEGGGMSEEAREQAD